MDRQDIDRTLADELIATAHALADAARVATLAHFRAGDLAADDKAGDSDGGRFDPVTAADRDCERAMRDILARRRPDDGILGEEYDNVPGTSGLVWVLDPVDGTRSFLAGAPTWGVLIAVADAGGPFYGIVDQPHIGERFEGGLGRAQLTGPRGRHPLATRAARPLDEAILFSTFPEIGTPQEATAFRRVSDRVRLTRYGTDCYGYMLIAAGQIDLVIEAGLFPFDIQAPMAVIEAAGGIVTDWDGAPCPMGGRVIAAANPAIHAEALALLAGGAA